MDQNFRDSIATVDKSGSRVWIYSKKPKGKFYNRRKLVSYILLAVLLGTPFIKVNGDPLMLFNILESRFIILGVHFSTQDFHIFVIAMLIGMIFIALFTVVYGRVFCGWVCPQTIFMEMVFRRIEYWIEGDASAQKRLAKSDWNEQKILKKLSKHLLFIAISAIIAHSFLAYIIGIDSLWILITDPVEQHLGGLIAMIIFTALFYGVFSIMREQVCTTICPYGRMQSVLLDKQSLVISYDYIRGEPRGKLSKEHRAEKKKCQDNSSSCRSACVDCKVIGSATVQSSATTNLIDEINQQVKGDCIDCKLCVQVCPTGIDIRNGTQLECVNCTACIDACDEVMDKIGKPKGLIRYDSHDGITKKSNPLKSTRVYAYSSVLIILLIVESFILFNRSEVETLIFRTPGMNYHVTEEGQISNLYNYQLINKTKQSDTLQLVVTQPTGAQIQLIGDDIIRRSHEITEGSLFILLDPKNIKERKTKIMLEVYSGDRIIDKASTYFISPKTSKK